MVATAADGSYVAVWVSYANDSTGDIIGQRFDSSGNAVGTEFTINTDPIGTLPSGALCLPQTSR